MARPGGYPRRGRRPAGGARAARRRVGLPGRRFVLLGRPLRGPAGRRRRRLLRRQAGPAESAGAGRPGRQLPPRQPGRLRRHRGYSGWCCRYPRCGRRPGRRPAKRAAEEVIGDRPRRPALGASGAGRLHRLAHLGRITGYRSPKPQPWPTPSATSRRKMAADPRHAAGVRPEIRLRGPPRPDRASTSFRRKAALDALDGRADFGFTFNPSHLHWQGVEPVEFVRRFPDRILNVHVKDFTLTLNGRAGLL